MKNLIALIWLVLLAMAPQTQASAVIAVTPESQIVVVGSSAQFDLAVSGLNDAATGALGSWDITLTYDPTLLSFQSASFGKQLDVLGLGSIQSTETPTANTVHIYEISLDSVADLSSLQQSAFNLASLTFTALSSGLTPLNLKLNALSDADGIPLTATFISGEAEITAVPLPSAVWFFVTAIGVVYFGTMRRNAIV
ncbi:cohesin domain-containing protein (plasmid) [Methylomonas sp. MS20]|uniref:cohesin domain-containing protein n=1 Tax=Methylomonas sp. MS20 TaxID=3418769 RepID=UPI003D024358